MSEKQFDMFDERFRYAAEQHEPPFDEASWARLESRLDAEKKRRRPFAWWWWFTDAVILGLVAYMAFTLPVFHPGNDKADATAGIVQSATNGKDENSDAANTSATEHKTDGSSVPGSDASQTISSRKMFEKESFSGNTQPSLSNPVNRKQQFAVQNQGALVSDDAFLNGASNQGIVHGKTRNEKEPVEHLTPDDKQIDNEEIAGAGGSATASSAITGNEQQKANLPEPKDDSAETKKAAVPKNKDKATDGKKGFFVYGSIGPEWSFVPGNKIGETTFLWGFGVGYQFSKKWAVQAGYFSTKKIYEAGPGDYQPKPGTYYYNLDIKHVAADCRITEIPIVVTYTFHQGKKHAFNAGVGLSSFIMNEEQYHYNYERMNGTPAYANYTYKTHNSHLFAGLLLSAGYRAHLFKNVSVKAEPYIKIPLYGVGEGSIKIYSFGVMAGVQYKLPSLRKK